MNVIRPPQPVLDKRGEPRVRRFEAQRWLLDNVIRANGIDPIDLMGLHADTLRAWHEGYIQEGDAAKLTASTGFPSRPAQLRSQCPYLQANHRAHRH